MGKMAEHFSKKVIITSDNPRFEDPDLICEDILKGCLKPELISVELNRKNAIKKAMEISKEFKNPVILVLGKGDEETQIIYDKKFLLNDKKLILDLINEHK